jgi:hypothetical protein
MFDSSCEAATRADLSQQEVDMPNGTHSGMHVNSFPMNSSGMHPNSVVSSRNDGRITTEYKFRPIERHPTGRLRAISISLFRAIVEPRHDVVLCFCYIMPI